MQFKQTDQYKPGDVLISRDEITKKLEEVAKIIAKDYAGQKVLLVTIMKGSFMVLADLIRALHEAGLTDTTLTALTVGSYGSGTESSRKPRFKHEVDVHVKDRHVLLVEDIVDTGHTLQFVIDELKSRGAKSIKTFALLSKPSRREIEIEAEYVGFVIPNLWVQGYGLDTDEWGRGNPDIIIGPITY